MLTEREHDVLVLLRQGLSNKHIARSLKIAPETVKMHVWKIFKKLGIHKRKEVKERFFS
jgi:DNA-binding NarL/FixJ family response regulator